MKLTDIIKRKEARLFRLERKCASLMGELDYLKQKQADESREYSDLPFEDYGDDFINDERLAQC